MQTVTVAHALPHALPLLILAVFAARTILRHIVRVAILAVAIGAVAFIAHLVR